MNIQIPKKQINNKGALQVHSIFNTIQGEGPFQGLKATFIRLSHCNLQCPNCDTDYEEENRHTIEEITNNIGSGSLAVITGGEPFRQNISGLCTELLRNRIRVQIETNGSCKPLDFTQNLREAVTIVCSPKLPWIHKEFNFVRHWKYILDHRYIDNDGLPLKVLGGARPFRPNPYYYTKIYVLPMDALNPKDNKKNLKACIDSTLQHGYQLQIQLHKYLELP